MASLSGRVALITGSTSGIGLAIAESLAKAGASIMLNGSRPAPEAEETRAKLARDSGVVVRYLPANLAEPQQARLLVEQTIATFGTLDILVNNAGIQHVAPTDVFPDEMFEKLMNINFHSVFHAIKAALPGMKARGWGRIINIGSAHSVIASPFKAPYVASKHAMVGFTKAVALEVAEQGITANVVCPAYVWTPLVQNQLRDQTKVHQMSEERVIREVMLANQPTKRFVGVDEVAAFALFLCSEGARSVTGSVQMIDGGWTAR